MPRRRSDAIPDRGAAARRETSQDFAVSDTATHVGIIVPHEFWPGSQNPRAANPRGDNVWAFEIWLQMDGGPFEKKISGAGPGGTFTFPDGSPVTEERWQMRLPPGTNRVVRVVLERFVPFRCRLHIEEYP